MHLFKSINCEYRGIYNLIRSHSMQHPHAMHYLNISHHSWEHGAVQCVHDTSATHISHIRIGSHLSSSPRSVIFIIRAAAGDVNASLSISPLTLRLKKAEWRCHRMLHFRMSRENVTVAHMRSRGLWQHHDWQKGGMLPKFGFPVVEWHSKRRRSEMKTNMRLVIRQCSTVIPSLHRSLKVIFSDLSI